jgi:hypothetical protein
MKSRGTEGVNTGANVNPTVSGKPKGSFGDRFISVKNSFLGFFTWIANIFRNSWNRFTKMPEKSLTSRSANVKQDPQSQKMNRNLPRVKQRI